MNDFKNYSPPRMRTIGESAKLLRLADPETALSENAIRTLVLKGIIPSTRVGKKFLIDFDRFLEHLFSSNKIANSESTSESSPEIRRIS